MKKNDPTTLEKLLNIVSCVDELRKTEDVNSWLVFLCNYLMYFNQLSKGF